LVPTAGITGRGRDSNRWRRARTRDRAVENSMKSPNQDMSLHPLKGYAADGQCREAN
jgi:hypothetical protein